MMTPYAKMRDEDVKGKQLEALPSGAQRKQSRLIFPTLPPGLGVDRKLGSEVTRRYLEGERVQRNPLPCATKGGHRMTAPVTAEQAEKRLRLILGNVELRNRSR